MKHLSKNIDDVVVPLPNEIFGALNKLDSVNWKEFVRTNKGTNFTERPRIALLLGDGDRRRLHRGAGGGCAEREGDRAARASAGQGDWSGQFDRAPRQGDHGSGRPTQMGQRAPGARSHPEQRATGDERVQDEKLSQLVSLGGWLRGTQVLTAVVNKHFTQEGAELLHQPDLLEYFGDRLTAMPEYSVPVVESIKRALVEVRPLIDTGNKPISPDSVKKINEITTRLDGEIVTRQ